MKKIVLFMMAFATIGAPFSKAQKQKKTVPTTTSSSIPAPLKTDLDTLSYAFGVSMVEQGLEPYLKQIGVIKEDTTEEVNNKNLDLFLKGVKEAITAKPENDAYVKGLSLGGQLTQMIENFGQVTGDEKSKVNMDAFISGFETSLKKGVLRVENASQLIQEKFTQNQDKASETQYAENRAAGEKFLAENKQNPEVITLPSGLQYKVLVEGTGEIPTETDQVKVHYRGALIDGTVFDSSIDRGEPITLGVGQVIRGWTEALKLMPVGSKWMLYIPSELGYGSRNAGEIPPFSTLIFEVELLGIEK
jgi:FKBP-type peptidyl-prolyl cis-trans isomerase FklB